MLTFLLVVAGALGAPQPAYAQDDLPPVDVHLTGLDPALPSRSDTLTIRGTARNTSSEPIDSAQVVLWRHRSSLTDLEDLRTVAGQTPESVNGYQLWTEGAYRRLAPEQQTWAPGETRTFELSVPMSAFSFVRTSGAYLIGAQVVGRHGGRTLSTLGQARVLLPLGPVGSAATEGTNTVASAVLLSSQPSMIEPGVFADHHLADELAPDGRLTVLLRSAQRDQVSWLVDPSLLDELRAMADGYVVRTPDGDQEGPGSDAAGRWLEAYGRLDPARGFRLPFAIPDLTLLQRIGLADVVRRAATTTDNQAADGLPLLVYSAGGALDNEAVALAESLGPAAILASGADARGALIAPVGTAPIINFSPGSTSGGPGPEPAQSLVQTRQRMLAESFLAANTESGSTTVRVITNAEAAEADVAAQAPWLRRTTLTNLLTETPVDWDRQLAYGDADRVAELTEPQVAALQEIVKGYGPFIEMLAEGEDTSRMAAATMARAASSWWRDDRQGFDRYAAPQLQAARQLWNGQSVELTAQRSVIMSGQSGSFPMTVTNNLDQPIRVTLTFESFQPQRLSIPAMPDLIIPANQGVTVNVQPKAVGNGPVRISAQVTTPGGTPVSKRVWLTVEATNFGRVGWIIVVASGIVLIATSALRIRQVRRERQAGRRVAPDVHTTPPVVTIDRSDPPPVGPDAAEEQPVVQDRSPEGAAPHERTPARSDGGEKR